MEIVRMKEDTQCDRKARCRSRTAGGWLIPQGREHFFRRPPDPRCSLIVVRMSIVVPPWPSGGSGSNSDHVPVEGGNPRCTSKGPRPAPARVESEHRGYPARTWAIVNLFVMDELSVRLHGRPRYCESRGSPTGSPPEIGVPSRGNVRKRLHWIQYKGPMGHRQDLNAWSKSKGWRAKCREN